VLAYSEDGGINDVTLELAAVPEPSAWTMFFAGLGALVLLKRAYPEFM